MPTLPPSPYVDFRNGGAYIAGTRIGLDVLIYDFRDGKTAEDILRSYPSIGALVKVYGAITYILEHPEEVEAYLAEMDVLWKKFEQEHPIPQDMLDRYYKGLEELKQRRIA